MPALLPFPHCRETKLCKAKSPCRNPYSSRHVRILEGARARSYIFFSLRCDPGAGCDSSSPSGRGGEYRAVPLSLQMTVTAMYHESALPPIWRNRSFPDCCSRH